jgi:hypothetical protein
MRQNPDWDADVYQGSLKLPEFDETQRIIMMFTAVGS